MKIKDSVTKASTPIPAPAEKSPFSSRPFAEPAALEVASAQPNTLHYSLRTISLAVQPKLTIGQPNDKYEQEADRVAEQVVQQINSPQFSATGSNNPAPNTTGNGKPKLQLKPIFQRRSAIEGEATPDLESSINRARGGGQALDVGLQRKMGQAMGADFSRVKVHTDAQSDQLNKSIQAKAFTTGQDVFFRQGAYEPSSRGGQELIAHELTHVVQQAQGRVKPTMQMQGDMSVNDAAGLEQEADVMGAKALATNANLAGEPEEEELLQGKSTPVQSKEPAQGGVMEHTDMQTQTLLSLRLIENDLVRVKWAAEILGSLSIPNLQTLVHLDGNKQISKYSELKKLFAMGGNIEANLSMQAAAIEERDIVEFNKKAGVTNQEILGCWNNLNNKIEEPTKQQVMRSFRIATKAEKADLEKLVNNFSQLQDRKTIKSTIVSSLLSVGLLRAKGNVYSSNTYGIGSRWLFEYVGQGKLIPEWHVHYQADGGKTKVTGAGWKNEKHGVGQKTFGSEEPLRKALKDAGVWQEPKI